MWLLRQVAPPGAAPGLRWWLPPGTYTVGRRADQADLVVEGDKSLSRRHAVLTVPAPDAPGAGTLALTGPAAPAWLQARTGRAAPDRVLRNRTVCGRF